MRWKTVLLIVTVVLLSAAGWFVLIGDPPLDPEVAAALERPPRLAHDENVFYAVAGFTVAPGRDPAEQGFEAVSRVNALLLRESADDRPASGDDVEGAWIEPALTFDDPQQVACAPALEGCLAALRDRGEQVRAAASANALLLERYASLLDYPAYQTETVPDVRMPLPRFASLLAVHRLALLRDLVAVLDGDAEARHAIARDVRFLRRLLVQADNLLMKIVAVSMLGDALHTYSAAGAVEPPGLPPLAPLSEAELSLERALLGEFRLIASNVTQLVDDGLLHRDLGVPEWMGGVVLRPLFKRNRTLHREFACLGAQLDASRRILHGEAPVGTAPDTQPCPPRWHDWLLNPVGTVLSSIAQPDFTRYAQRLRALQGLVTLVEAARALRAAGVPAHDVEGWLTREHERFHGPFDREPLAFDAATRTISFTSPMDANGLDRLRLEPFAAPGP